MIALTGSLQLIGHPPSAHTTDLNLPKNKHEEHGRGPLDEDLAFAIAVGNGHPDAQGPLQFLLGFFDVWVPYADLFDLFREVNQPPSRFSAVRIP